MESTYTYAGPFPDVTEGWTHLEDSWFTNGQNLVFSWQAEEHPWQAVRVQTLRLGHADALLATADDEPVDPPMAAGRPFPFLGGLRHPLWRRYGVASVVLSMGLDASGYDWVWDTECDAAPDPRLLALIGDAAAVAAACRDDVLLRPRPPERIPVWVKARLAAVGGWDVERDGPTFTRDAYLGRPVPLEEAATRLRERTPSVVPHVAPAPDPEPVRPVYVGSLDIALDEAFEQTLANAAEGLCRIQDDRYPGCELTMLTMELGNMGGQISTADGRRTEHLVGYSGMWPSAIDDVRRLVWEQFGLASVVVRLSVDRDRNVTWDVDPDGPFDLADDAGGWFTTEEGRAEACLADLQRHPRPPERVPAWVKAWLATQGAWDVDGDRLATTKGGDPTSVPVPYDEAYARLKAATPSVVPFCVDQRDSLREADARPREPQRVDTSPAALMNALGLRERPKRRRWWRS